MIFPQNVLGHLIRARDSGNAHPTLGRQRQFTAVRFTKCCAMAGIEVSMGSVGDCYDNAICETFHASLKKEKIYRQSWPTRAAARTAVFWVHRRLEQPAAPALNARLPVPDRVRAKLHRARSTGARGPDFAQQIVASISLPAPRSLPRTASSSQPVPLRPRREAVKGRTAAGRLSDP